VKKRKVDLTISIRGVRVVLFRRNKKVSVPQGRSKVSNLIWWFQCYCNTFCLFNRCYANVHLRAYI